jgi:hypothetical protein
VLFNPFIMSEMSREGIWDQGPFVQSIENREYDLIMLRFIVGDPASDDRPGAGTYAGWDRFTESMEAAIEDNYEIDFDISPIYMRRLWFIYRPIQEEVVEEGTGLEEMLPFETEEEFQVETEEEAPVETGDNEAQNLLGGGE